MPLDRTNAAVRILAQCACVATVCGLGYLVFLIRAHRPDEKPNPPSVAEPGRCETGEGHELIRLEKTITLDSGKPFDSSEMWTLINERNILREENANLRARVLQLQAELNVASKSAESNQPGESGKPQPSAVGASKSVAPPKYPSSEVNSGGDAPKS